MDPDIDLTADKGPACLAIAGTGIALSAVAVVLRLYTRLIIMKNGSFDDAFISVAWVLSLVVTIGTSAEVKSGMGRHVMVLTPDNLVGMFKALYITIIVYNFGLMFTKLSILSQYLRVCASRQMRIVCYAVIAFVAAYGIETFCSGLLTCRPIAFYWNQTIPGGKCVNEFALYFANGGINIFTDFMILIIPIFLLKGLMMPMRQKVILMGVLAFGSFACIASIVRVYVLYRLSKSQDPSWDNPPTAYWSSIELNVGIICASVSTLRPMLALIMPRIFASEARQNQYNRYQASDRARRNQLQRESANGQFNQIHGPGQIHVRKDVDVRIKPISSVGSGSVTENIQMGAYYRE